MGKPRLPNQKKAYKELSKRLAGYMMRVRSIYDRFNEKAAAIVESVGYDGSVEFSFSDYPEVKRDLQLLQKQFVGELQTLIYSGTSSEWKNSNTFQDAVADKALKYYRAQVHGDRFKHYYRDNGDQLKAFLQRKENGLNLSSKLWNQSDNYKESLEATISTAIEKGMSATALSKKLSRYLNDWPSLQADYQEKYGKATNIHDCEYRSLRLARNEISMAYRSAEQARWQQFDFILGYKIKISDSHPRYDICDDLAGDYPKDFKFRGWHPNCYSDDTQVLTNHGWRLFKDVRWEDVIFSLNPSTHNVEWVGIDDMQEYESNGKMYHFFNKSLDCLVTPEHRMVYLNKSDGRIKYCLAKDYTKGKGAFYRGCEYIADDIDTIEIGEKKYPFDLFCEFMGYYLSDGSIQHKTGIIISQKDGQPYKYMIVDCIKNMGFAPRMKEDTIEFYNVPLNRYLTQFGIARKKFIPTIIKNASKKQIQIFLDAFIKCDGYTRKTRKSFVGSHGNIFVPKLEEKMYFTTSPQMASDLSELILKVGKRPSFRVQKPTDARKKDGTIIHGNFECWIISECKSLTSTVFEKKEVSYKGKVYDLTLKKNHIMYVRRNGKCFWGSNCLCYTVPIVMSEDEYWSENRENSPNMVTAPPENFGKWVSENSERIDEARSRGTLPYWVMDNREFVKLSALAYKESLKPSPFIMTDETVNKLAARNINISRVEIYNESTISGFDIDRFDSFMENVGDENKIFWKSKRITIFPNGNANLTYDGEYIDSKGNKQNPYLSRMFRMEDDKKIVYHDVFNLPSELQGKGLSKSVFRELFKSYESMGIDRVEVLANMDVGGYCWGRYGFSAKTSEIKDLVQRRFSEGVISQNDFEYVSEILKMSGPNIRMNEIANLKCGKALLLSNKVKWRGFIDLHDKHQMDYLHDYIGLRK